MYVHYPWCLRKCPYCDFNSHQLPEGLDNRAYLNALLADLDEQLPDVSGRNIQTVFIGGGTPSLLSGDELFWLLAEIRRRGRLAETAEITLEANPGAVDAGNFARYRQAGVNRLSIGVQSFNDESLQRIGRIHDRSAALSAVAAAADAGFDNINLDLMFGLPGQGIGAALADLNQAVALAPTHLSWYQLTLEPNTPFAHQPPRLPDDDRIAEIQELGQQALADAGYAQYEVSAYARQGRQCRHNLNYWQFGDYLGIGAGAHGKLTGAGGGIVRYHKSPGPQRYLGNPASDNRQQVEMDELPVEFMLNALRLTGGFEPMLFEQRTGLPLQSIQAPLQQADERGLLYAGEDRVSPTRLGRRFLNDLIMLFDGVQENGPDKKSDAN